MPWTHVVVNEMPEVLFVIYPDSDGAQYQVKTVPVEAGSFKTRLDLPKAWSGLRDQELAAVTGVADSVFCHLNLFIGGARSLDGATQAGRGGARYSSTLSARSGDASAKAAGLAMRSTKLRSGASSRI